jgi:hypothetical protein
MKKHRAIVRKGVVGWPFLIGDGDRSRGPTRVEAAGLEEASAVPIRKRGHDILGRHRHSRASSNFAPREGLVHVLRSAIGLDLDAEHGLELLLRQRGLAQLLQLANRSDIPEPHSRAGLSCRSKKAPSHRSVMPDARGVAVQPLSPRPVSPLRLLIPAWRHTQFFGKIFEEFLALAGASLRVHDRHPDEAHEPRMDHRPRG